MRIGRAAGVTDTGRRRLRNEDAFICEPPLFAVADGMGGARAGEIAAGLAAAALEEAGSETRGAEGIRDLIIEANRRIWERSVADPKTAGMGTTVTAALVDADGGTVAIGHVGDSRAYLLRGGSLEQLTTDHSLVAELVESGVLTPEEAERHPQRSAITRALGTEPTVEVDGFTIDAEPGDLFLICSDGLSVMLADKQMAAAIKSSDGDPAGAAEALVAAANDRGGEDNVTVVLFEMLDAGVPEVAPPTPEEPSAVDDQEADTSSPEEPVSETPVSENAVSETPASETPPEPGSLRRHGAGPGGRLAALLLLAAIVGLSLLALYVVVRR
ncbi:MAG: Stp1/IreP family PP2C-type Ser/Thr phosphatase [Actinobacteria bacterium]|nr:Stp1/IreP family PP2C-type Ser/Thr phosphatase [Actinomycetota bacterium]